MIKQSSKRLKTFCLQQPHVREKEIEMLTERKEDDPKGIYLWVMLQFVLGICALIFYL
jgi:hypothetical protein